METNKQYKKSKMKSSIILSVPTNPNVNIKSSFELNINERHASTSYYKDNKQKLLDFISDKNKLCLKSYFDHKGAKRFLNGKDEAMKKIELNENIEENEIKTPKNANKNNKKMMKMKSEEYTLKNNKINKKILNSEISNKKQKKMRNSKSNKFLSNVGKNQLININEVFNDFDLDELPKWETVSPVNKHHKKAKSIKDKIKREKKVKKEKKEKKEKKNNDKSIISIVTVDSKLFNNKKEYDNYKKLATKEDFPIIENIINELDVNKKS